MPVQLSFVEDIVFGTDAMHPSGVKDFSKWVKDKVFTVGSIPPRVGGIKLYDTSEDEVIIEVPLLFGSNVKVRWPAQSQHHACCRLMEMLPWAA